MRQPNWCGPLRRACRAAAGAKRIHRISLYAAVAGLPPRGDRVLADAAERRHACALFTAPLIVIETFPQTTREQLNMSARDYRAPLPFMKTLF